MFAPDPSESIERGDNVSNVFPPEERGNDSVSVPEPSL